MNDHDKIIDTYQITGISIILGSILGILLFEHVGRLYSRPRPSHLLKWIADKAIFCFTTIGVFVARISSFYTYLHLWDILWDILTTIDDIIFPLARILFSPLYMFGGYISTTRLYSHPYAIVFGSTTIIAILGGGCLWYWELTFSLAAITVFIRERYRGFLVIASLIIAIITTYIYTSSVPKTSKPKVCITPSGHYSVCAYSNCPNACTGANMYCQKHHQPGSSNVENNTQQCIYHRRGVACQAIRTRANMYCSSHQPPT